MFSNKEFKEAADKVILPRAKRKGSTGLTIEPGMTKDQLREFLLAAQEKGIFEKLFELCGEDSVQVPTGLSREERRAWAQDKLKEVISQVERKC